MNRCDDTSSFHLIWRVWYFLVFWVRKLMKWGEKNLGGGLYQSCFLLQGGIAFSLLSYFPKGTHQGIAPTETLSSCQTFSPMQYPKYSRKQLHCRPSRSVLHIPIGMQNLSSLLDFVDCPEARNSTPTRKPRRCYTSSKPALLLHASSEWTRLCEHCGGTTSSSKRKVQYTAYQTSATVRTEYNVISISPRWKYFATCENNLSVHTALAVFAHWRLPQKLDNCEEDNKIDQISITSQQSGSILPPASCWALHVRQRASCLRWVLKAQPMLKT